MSSFIGGKAMHERSRYKFSFKVPSATNVDRSTKGSWTLCHRCIGQVVYRQPFGMSPMKLAIWVNPHTQNVPSN